MSALEVSPFHGIAQYKSTFTYCTTRMIRYEHYCFWLDAIMARGTKPLEPALLRKLASVAANHYDSFTKK